MCNLIGYTVILFHICVITILIVVVSCDLQILINYVPWLGKRELICLLLLTCDFVVSVGEVSSSTGCLGWATLFHCGTPCAFHIIILQFPWQHACLREISRCLSS